VTEKSHFTLNGVLSLKGQMSNLVNIIFVQISHEWMDYENSTKMFPLRERVSRRIILLKPQIKSVQLKSQRSKFGS